MTAGVIHIEKTDGSSPTDFWAENVQVSKTLPLQVVQTVDNGSANVDTSGTSSSSTSQTPSSPRKTIKFTLTVSPSGLSRSEFLKKRQSYLFGFDVNEVVVKSEMFDTVSKMQFTSIGYEIPSGCEYAVYSVELTEIVDSDQVYNASGGSTTSNSKCGSMPLKTDQKYVDNPDAWPADDLAYQQCINGVTNP